MSVETLTLKTPVLIDGESVRELTYDIDAIGVEQFVEAESRAGAKSLSGGSMSASPAAEVDYSFHLYLGIMAVLAANPGYTVEDVERVKGPDVMKLMRVGRGFMTAGSGEEDDEESHGPEETTEAVEASDGDYLTGLE